MAASDRGSHQQRPLGGARVLIVEDEYFIADDLRRVLSGAGAIVLGPVSTLTDAYKALEMGAFNCAVIDLNLYGESAIPIADRLMRKGTPFVIATGYGSSVVPARLESVAKIEKPFDPTAMVGLIVQAISAKSH